MRGRKATTAKTQPTNHRVWEKLVTAEATGGQVGRRKGGLFKSSEENIEALGEIKGYLKQDMTTLAITQNK